MRGGGGGGWGFCVLELVFKRVFFGNFDFRHFNLMCGIAVSSSPAVSGFLSLWRTVFAIKEDPSRTVLRHRSFVLSCLM